MQYIIHHHHHRHPSRTAHRDPSIRSRAARRRRTLDVAVEKTRSPPTPLPSRARHTSTLDARAMKLTAASVIALTLGAQGACFSRANAPPTRTGARADDERWIDRALDR
jgi:hypothetical protein